MLKYSVPRFPAANVQAAIEYYEKKMGFTRLFDYGDYAAVERDAVEIHLWECQDQNIALNTACRVAVDRSPVYGIHASGRYSPEWNIGRKALGSERVRCTGSGWQWHIFL